MRAAFVHAGRPVARDQPPRRRAVPPRGNPVSPVPAAARASSAPAAGRAARRATRSPLGSSPEQVAPAVPARRHLLPELVGGLSPREATARASSASSSGAGSHSPAAAFARTCSGVVAPAITEATVGCAARPPIATSSSRSAAVARERLERLDAVPRRGRRGVETLRRQARALGRRLAAAVLAGQQPAREREVRDQPEPEPLARRDQVVLGVAGEPRVLVLRRDEPRQPALGARASSASSTCAAGEVGASRCSAPCPRGRARPSRRASPRSA